MAERERSIGDGVVAILAKISLILVLATLAMLFIVGTEPVATATHVDRVADASPAGILIAGALLLGGVAVLLAGILAPADFWSRRRNLDIVLD